MMKHHDKRLFDTDVTVAESMAENVLLVTALINVHGHLLHFTKKTDCSLNSRIVTINGIVHIHIPVRLVREFK